MNKPLVCNMNALSPEQHQQRTRLFYQLEQAAEKVQELADGYAFCYAPGNDLWMTAATFVNLERRCCPFFTFSLKQQEDLMRLQITGPKRVKTFMKNQFNL